MINISERYYGDKESLYECKAKVMESMDYLQSLLNNALDIGKVESGKCTADHRLTIQRGFSTKNPKAVE